MPRRFASASSRQTCAPANCARMAARSRCRSFPSAPSSYSCRAPNQVLTRDDCRHALWPDGTFVDFDRGISSTINRLREALDDTASNPRFIETVTRTGYRWIAPIQVVTPPPESGFPIEALARAVRRGAERQPSKSNAFRGRRSGRWVLPWPCSPWPQFSS